MIVWLVACAGTPGPASATPPDGFSCPPGSTYAVEVSADVRVHGCRSTDGSSVGPHLERFLAGGVAAEGAWLDGERQGEWTRWFPDGAFRSRAVFAAGVEHGPRHEVSGDGRILEVEMKDGVAVGLRGLTAATPMPEWDGGQRVEGVRYAAHASQIMPSPSP